MADTTTTPVKIKTFVPDWVGRVDQTDRTALAKFLNDMPNVKMTTHEEISAVSRQAIELACPWVASIVIKEGQILIEPASDPADSYYCFCGTHIELGNFATFWSGRGPGDDVRPRPCFMFWDGEPVWLEQNNAA